MGRLEARQTDWNNYMRMADVRNWSLEDKDGEGWRENLISVQGLFTTLCHWLLLLLLLLLVLCTFLMRVLGAGTFYLKEM